MATYRRTVLTVATLAVLALAAPAQGALVAHWAFDEGTGTTLYNSVGGGPTGTLYGSTWIAGRPGAGSAIRFRGTATNYADLTGSDTSLHYLGGVDGSGNPNPFSVSTWVNTTESGQWFRALVAKFGSSGINNFWGLGWMNTNQLGFNVRNAAGTFQRPAAPVGWGLDGQWHQVIGVRSGGASGKVSFYGDGQLLDERTDNVGDASNTRPIWVAQHAGAYVPESVDDVAIWNEALTPYAIDLAFKRGTPPSQVVGATNRILADIPVAYWRFEETGIANLAADFSGNGRTATYQGGVGRGSERSLLYDGQNRYAAFNGASHYVTANDVLPSTAFGGGGSYSIEMWFNADGLHQGALIALSSTDDDGHGVLLEAEANGQLRFLHRVPTSATGTNIYTNQALDPYVPGQWHHLAAVKDGALNQMLLYLDGGLVGTASDSTTIDFNMYVTIGRLSRTQSARYFAGAIDELVLYNRALSAQEVWAHVHAAVPEPSGFVLGGFGLFALGLLALRRRRG